MPRTSTTLARWGLLVTTLVMGVAMVITGVMGYLGARESAWAVIRARGTDTLFAVRRGFMMAGQPSQATLDRVFASMESQGVRFIGLVDVDGQLRIGAGEPTTPLRELPTNPPRLGPHLQRIGDGRLVRSVSFLVPMRVHRTGDIRSRLGASGLSDPRLVVEFEPLVANLIEYRALVSLVVSLSAAAVLLAAAVFFWRLSRRAERIAAQLERDRRLAVLGEMSAVLGHELRNPLAALKGHAQLLLEKLSADHPGRGGTERVVREVMRLESLTCQVLDFARSGELRLADTQPEELIQAAVEQVDSDRVRIVINAALPSWQLDRDRVQQVLINLLDNALQASAESEKVVLTVKLEDDQLVISVRDRGEGIPQKEAERVFEPFYTRRTRGTGLGLAVAKRIVEGHGGKIEATSHPEGGSVFSVRFPRRA